MHVTPNFKTKKALKEAVKDANEHAAADFPYAFQPGGFFPSQTDGQATIEGPHDYHKWYARVELKDGDIVKVIG